MDKERIIHDFIDGSLSPAQEEKLFLDMSSDNALRSEFKQQMAIKNAIKSDTKAFSPKAASTMAVFSTLGISGAGAASSASAASNPAPSAAPAPQPQPSIWKQYAQGMSSGLTAALGTAAVFLILFMSGMFDKEVRNTAPLASHEPVPVIISQEIPNEIVYRNEHIAGTNSGNRRNSGHNSSNYDTGLMNQRTPLYSQDQLRFSGDDLKSALTQGNQEALNRTDNTGTFSNNMNNIPLDASNTLRMNRPFNNNGSNEIFASNRNGKRSSLFENVAVELNGSAFYQDNEEINPGSGYQKFNNMGVQLFYALNDELKVGMEYKRENYYQKYQGFDAQGYLWEYKQHPNFQSYGFTVRYTPDYLKYKFVKPAVQTSFGGTEAGPYGRALAGAEFSINDNFNVTLGADYSILFYKHNNTYFNSDKYGVYFGTGIKF